MLGILNKPAISRFRTDYAPQVYYLWYNAAIVCILPWLAILWKDLGFNGGQIGILAGLRPFIAALSGQTLVGFADAHQLHFVITVATYIVTFLCRGGMGVFASFIGHAMLILFSEACQAPFSIMSDAAAAAASKDEGDYGMRKLWGSVGWGLVAPLCGWVVQRWGVSRSIAIYFGLVLGAFIPLVLLPIEKLSAKRRRSQSGSAEAPRSPAGAAAAKKLGMREPLLSATEERRHGGKAAELAIELTDSVEFGGGPESLSVLPVAIQEEERRPSPPLQQVEEPANWRIPASPAALMPPSSPPAAAQPTIGLPAINTSGLAGGSGASLPTPSRAFPFRDLHIDIPAARRPSSSASMASTAFYSVRSTATPSTALGGGFLGLSQLAKQVSNVSALSSSLGASAPNATPLEKQISNMSDLTSLLDVSVHSPSEGFFSPFAGAPTPFASTPPGSSTHGPMLGSSHSPAPGSSNPGDLQQHSQQQWPGFAPADLPLAAGIAGGPAAAAAPMLGQAALEALQLPRVNSVHPTGFVPQPPPTTSPAQLDRPSGCMLAPLLVASRPHSHEDEAATPAAGAIKESKHWAAGAGMLPVSSLTGSGINAGTKAAISISVVAGPVGAAPPAGPSPPPQDPRSLSVLGGILHLLHNPHVAGFFFLIWLSGIGYGCVGYLALFLREQGGSGLLMGLCQTVNCVGEVIALYTSSYWLSGLGIANSINLSMLGWVLRLGGYVLVPFFPSPWLVLPLEILQGLTFGVVYCAGTINCKRIAPPHLRSTTQSMLFCLYYGFGPGVSGLAGGYIYQARGMRSVFVIFGTIILVGWLATLLLLRCFAGPEQGSSSQPQPGALTEPVPTFAQPAPTGADGGALSAASAARLAAA